MDKLGRMEMPPLARRLVAEVLGSALLCMVVIGSGIAAARLSPDDVGLQLLENALATAFGLGVLILILAPVSGAHFNPVVSLVDTVIGRRPWRETALYAFAQIGGCIGGAILANAMFGEPLVAFSTTDRLSPAVFLSEVVATAGLVVVIFTLARSGRPAYVPVAVGAWIGGAYFFTSSTSFANPAITVGRMVSDTFAGIAPSSAPGFIGAQLLGGALAVLIVRYLYPAATIVDSRVSPNADVATAESSTEAPR